nr:PREDICTED: male-specific lethal 3 homolog [Bemisia tabaci]
MVSTRGIKFRFSEGERVLCYEPDPAKAKVLYDSKVLKIVKDRSENGRKLVEYLIHFQGWNSTWDRYVTEDYILKDTEENKQLQKELAQKAQLTAGGNLYRRERKKKPRRLSEKINESLEVQRARKRRNSIDERPTSESSTGTEEPILSPLFHLPPLLKKHLDLDYEMIKRKNKLVKAPAQPNIITILENFVKHCAFTASNSGEDKPRHHYHTSHKMRRKVNKFDTVELNICKEVVDGLRILLDFTLGDILLYSEETEQYEQLRNKPVVSPDRNEPACSTSPLGADEPFQMKEEFHVKKEYEDPDSHLYHSEFEGASDLGRKKTLRSHKCPLEPSILNGVPDKPSRSIGSRLSSTETPAVKFESISSVTSVSSYGSALDFKTNLMASPNRAAVLSDLLNWHLTPDEMYNQIPVPPSLIYGAIHLLRLFVKLPELLMSSITLCDKFDSTITIYINKFLQFLECHAEWFEESFYEDRDISLSDLNHDS